VRDTSFGHFGQLRLGLWLPLAEDATAHHIDEHRSETEELQKTATFERRTTNEEVWLKLRLKARKRTAIQSQKENS